MDDFKKTVRKGLLKLKQIETELKKGESFSITRLLVLKKLCENPIARFSFAKYICEKTYIACKDKKGINANRKALITEAIELMEQKIIHYEKTGRLGFPNQSKKRLEKIYGELMAYQNHIRHGYMGTPIRTILNNDLFTIELGIKSFLFEDARAGYELARQYSEKNDSQYWYGLNRKSLKPLHDIIEFWDNYNKK